MNHSALHPHGVHAAQIAHLGWIFLAVSAAVYIIVIVTLCVVLYRRRHSASDPTLLSRNERRALTAIGISVGITAVVVTGLAVGDFVTGRALNRNTADALQVKITGHRWWWEIEYMSAGADKRLRTANELHIPVGRPVKLLLASQDVIHSFWVPNLQGKRDLIPGRSTTITLQADEPGRYEGQCAEFCGLEHAKMGIVVDAEPPSRFQAWMAAQLKPAPEPATDQQRHGREVFESSGCVLCHTIHGTSASAVLGPDLTHVASRSTIAAGALPNTRGTLVSWITDPPAFKPGTPMPATVFASADLIALADYLSSLE